MGFIDAVRAWLFGADDTDDADDAGESGDETDVTDADEPDASATDADEPDGLDPAAATETRTATATDDAVDALRDVRRSQGSNVSTESGAGDGPTASNEEEPRPPDDDRPKSSDGGGTNR